MHHVHAKFNFHHLEVHYMFMRRWWWKTVIHSIQVLLSLVGVNVSMWQGIYCWQCHFSIIFLILVHKILYKSVHVALVRTDIHSNDITVHTRVHVWHLAHIHMFKGASKYKSQTQSTIIMANILKIWIICILCLGTITKLKRLI